MKRHVMMALMAMGMAVAVDAPRAQQPTADYYDTTKTVTIKGTVRLALVVPPPAPMIIGLEVSDANGPKDQKGQKEMYFLAGNLATSLRRDGWQLIGPAQAIKSGDAIAVTAFLPKDEQKAAKALRAIVHMPAPGGQSSGPPGFIADVEAKRARLAYGLEITKADGEKLRFGDVP
jgi:hypothetical protein